MLIAVALVLLQTLGAIHRIAHGTHGPGSARSFAEVPASVGSDQAPAWMHKLFAGHEQAGVCDLFDQAAHADAAFAAPSMPVSVLLPQTLPPCRTAQELAREVQAAYARGPPSAV